MAAAPEGLLAQLSAWQKDGLQKLTFAADEHKTALQLLIQQAEAEILELVQPFDQEKPRNKRRAGAKQKEGLQSLAEHEEEEPASNTAAGKRRRGAAATGAASKRGRRDQEPEDSDADGTVQRPAWGYTEVDGDTASTGAGAGEAQQDGADDTGGEAVVGAPLAQLEEEEPAGEMEEEPAPRATRRGGRGRARAAAPPPARTSGRSTRARTKVQQQEVLDIIAEEPAGPEEEQQEEEAELTAEAPKPSAKGRGKRAKQAAEPTQQQDQTAADKQADDTPAGDEAVQPGDEPAADDDVELPDAGEQEDAAGDTEVLEEDEGAVGAAVNEEEANAEPADGPVVASPHPPAPQQQQRQRQSRASGIQLLTSGAGERQSTPRLAGAAAGSRRSRAAGNVRAMGAATRVAVAPAASDSPAAVEGAAVADADLPAVHAGAAAEPTKGKSLSFGLPLAAPLARGSGAAVAAGFEDSAAATAPAGEGKEEKAPGVGWEPSFGAGLVAEPTATKTPTAPAEPAVLQETPVVGRGGALVATSTPSATPLPAAAPMLAPTTGGRVTRSAAKATLQAAGAAAAPSILAAASAGVSTSAAAGPAVAPGANVVSGIRSFLPSFMQTKKQGSPQIAAGKNKIKVKALEAAQAARKAEEARLADKARQREVGTLGKPPGTANIAAAPKPKQPATRVPVAAEGADATTSSILGADAQHTPADAAVAVADKSAAGQAGGDAGSGAMRVPVPLPKAAEEEGAGAKRPGAVVAEPEAAKRKAERDAEAAKKAMDKQEREERAKRVEAKRREEEARRRAELEEKQRQKDERMANRKQQMAAGGANAGGTVGTTRAPGMTGTAAGIVRPGHGAPVTKPPQQQHTKDTLPAAKALATKPGGAAAVASTPVASTLQGSRLRTPGRPQDASGSGQASQQLADKALMPPPTAHKTPAAPPVTEQERHNIEMLKKSPFVNMGSKRTPKLAMPNPHSYEISPYRDDEEATPDRSGKPIPDWARSHNLMGCLKQQRHIDPDEVFRVKQTSCPLDDIFKGVELLPNAQPTRPRKRELHQRTSSGDWSRDKVTWNEEITYKKAMGYV